MDILKTLGEALGGKEKGGAAEPDKAGLDKTLSDRGGQPKREQEKHPAGGCCGSCGGQKQEQK